MKRNITTGLLLMALFSGYGAYAQNAEERAWITKHYDMDKARAMEVRFRDRAIKEKEEALRLAEVNGWPVIIEGKDGSYQELKKVIDGQPIYIMSYNAGAAILSKINRVRNNGGAGLNLEGQGMILGEWDEGPVRRTHVEFAGGRVLQRDGAAGTASMHATHVAGTLVASGVDSEAKGMAPQAILWAHNWGQDLSEMTARAGEGLLVSNHSYGINANAAPAWMFGAYDTESWSWDDITNTFPYYQPVVAAGNDRAPLPYPNQYPNTKGGRELITQQATSKNIITVAAVQMSNPVAVANFSNFGPTDDRRIKPDIAAKGVSVYSTSSSGNSDYIPQQGTSMASPVVSGGLILLQQHYKNLNNGTFMRAATLKALMSHTAAEFGPIGPDFQVGWGILDVEAGAAVITGNNDTSAKIIETTLAQGGVYTTQVKADGINPLKVTIAWNDPAGDPNFGTNDLTTPVLVNDLDVRLIKVAGSVEYKPWRLNRINVNNLPEREDNFVDNIEKIEIVNAAGTAIEIPATNDAYTIEVRHKGTLVGGSQAFSLIVSGINAFGSVNTNEVASKISVWPNPAKDVLNVSFGDLGSESAKVEIYDIQGRIMLSKNITVSQEQSLDISNLGSGAYIVNVSSDTFKVSKKIIKN